MRRGLVGLLVGVIVGAVVAAGGFAIANVGDDDETVFYTCENTRNGRIRSITADAEPRCNLRREVIVSWSDGGSVGSSAVEEYSAATFRLTSDGCASGEYRWVVHETWGAEVQWQQVAISPQGSSSQCSNFERVDGSKGGVAGLAVMNQLPSGYTYWKECGYQGLETWGWIEIPEYIDLRRGPSYILDVFTGRCSAIEVGYNGGDWGTWLASGPVTRPIVIYRSPSDWVPPMSPPMTQPKA